MGMSEDAKHFEAQSYADDERNNSDLKDDPRFLEATTIANEKAEAARRQAEEQGQNGRDAYIQTYNTVVYEEFVKRIMPNNRK